MIHSEQFMEEIEEKRIKVLDLELGLNNLRKDLARSHRLLDMLRDNEN